jgi:hypothetical protein
MAGTAVNYFAGDVGIGTASPGSRLEVSSSSNQAALFKTSAAGSYGAVQIFNTNTNGEASIGFRDNSDSDSTSWVIGKSVGATDAFGFFYGSTRMVIDSSGNVGIGGTGNATDKVAIAGTLPSNGGNSLAFINRAEVPSTSTSGYQGYTSLLYTQAASFTLTNATHFQAQQVTIGVGSTVTNQYGFRVDSGMTGATNNFGFYSNIASGSNRWNFYAAGTAKNYFAGNTGINVDPGSNTFAAVGPSGANATYALTSQSGYGTFLNMGVNGGNRFEISVSSGGDLSFTTNGVSADVMKITRTSSVSNTLTLDKGEVLCGNATDNGPYNLQCNGTGVWGAGAYVNGSDARLKDDITTLNDGLNVVSQLRPVTFKYKPDYSKDQNVQTGFIAQELQAVLAGKDYVDGIVQAGPNHLNVAYQSLIPILVKAIQELTARVAELEAK